MIGSEARVYYVHRANGGRERERTLKRERGKEKEGERARKMENERAIAAPRMVGRGDASSLASRSSGRERDEDAAKTNENG